MPLNPKANNAFLIMLFITHSPVCESWRDSNFFILHLWIYFKIQCNSHTMCYFGACVY